ncbi:MAG: hypothetical protein ACYTA3_01800 [Planctomycetota bacterium]|jgi:hypothetical protein
MLLHAPCSRRPVSALLCGIFATVFLANPVPAQEGDSEECCPIIIIDGESHVLYARYKDSGRVFQVRVSAEDIARVRIGDMIAAELTESSAVVTHVAGASRNYTSVVPLPHDWEPNHGFAPTPEGWEPTHGATGEISDPDIDRVIVPQPDFGEECCPMAPNTELMGATGRLLVNALEGVKNFHVEVFQAGTTERATDWYGNKTIDLIPGRYDVVVSGVKLENVAIDRRSDTTVRLGALAISLSGNAHWGVYDASKETRYTDGYGSGTIALPVGTYFVGMAGGYLEVEIKDGQVTGI